jgi:hypothetical protein
MSSRQITRKLSSFTTALLTRVDSGLAPSSPPFTHLFPLLDGEQVSELIRFEELALPPLARPLGAGHERLVPAQGIMRMMMMRCMMMMMMMMMEGAGRTDSSTDTY